MDIRDTVLSLVLEGALPLHLFVICSKEGRVLESPMGRIVEWIGVVSHGRLRVDLAGVLMIAYDRTRLLDEVEESLEDSSSLSRRGGTGEVNELASETGFEAGSRAGFCTTSLTEYGNRRPNLSCPEGRGFQHE